MESGKVFSKDYSCFTASDFLGEESFITWVKHRGENRNLDLYWEMICEKYPGLTGEINKAITIVHLLNSQTNYVGGTSQAESWKRVKKGIAITRPLRLMGPARQFFLRYRNTAAVIASVVLLSAALYGGYTLRPTLSAEEAFTTIYSPAGQRTEVTLPDNSKVLLNSKTTLKYSAAFNIDDRKLSLDGEAYFDVRKSHLPFEVRTEAMNIRVLGTAFNVKCYSDEPVVEATLVRGSMIVEKIDHETGTSEEILLKPNQKVVFQKKQIASLDVSEKEKKDSGPQPGETVATKPREAKKLNLIESYDTKKSTGWIDGFLIIDGETLVDLSKKIERRYDVSIVFMSERLKKFKYTGTLREYSLEQLLKAMEATSPISCRVDKQMVYIDENKEEINKYRRLMN